MQKLFGSVLVWLSSHWIGPAYFLGMVVMFVCFGLFLRHDPDFQGTEAGRLKPRIPEHMEFFWFISVIFWPLLSGVFLSIFLVQSVKWSMMRLVFPPEKTVDEPQEDKSGYR